MLHSVLSNLARNINTLKSKAFDLEMRWVEGKRPNLHPYVASMARQELETLLKIVKEADTRYWYIVDKIKKNEQR